MIIAGVTLVGNPNNSTNELTAGFFGIVGLVALAMSVFTLFQSRRQVAQMKIETPKVMTTVECKCGSKTQREFQRGDYVYKELDVPCQKCLSNKWSLQYTKKSKKKKKHIMYRPQKTLFDFYFVNPTGSFQSIFASEELVGG